MNETACESARLSAQPRMHLKHCTNPHVSAIVLINTRATSSPGDGKVQALTSTLWINTQTTAEIYLLKETISVEHKQNEKQQRR